MREERKINRREREKGGRLLSGWKMAMRVDVWCMYIWMDGCMHAVGVMWIFFQSRVSRRVGLIAGSLVRTGPNTFSFMIFFFFFQVTKLSITHSQADKSKGPAPVQIRAPSIIFLWENDAKWKDCSAYPLNLLKSFYQVNRYQGCIRKNKNKKVVTFTFMWTIFCVPVTL